MWWGPLASHGMIVAGALTQPALAGAVGLLGTALSVAAFHDIARSPVVPGANDNLSGVAVLVGLAERLRAQPVEGLRVLPGLLRRRGGHPGRHPLVRPRALPAPPGSDLVPHLETVGSPQLILLEGEGPLVMEDYHDSAFRDLVALRERAGASLKRGFRARSSTDAVIPSRAGYPTATLSRSTATRRWPTTTG